MVKCDIKECNKNATYNIQSNWHLYKVKHREDGGDEYSEIKDWEGDTNEHFCTEHADAELLLGLSKDEILKNE